jgi:flagellar hook-basal body complex protein FliE
VTDPIALEVARARLQDFEIRWKQAGEGREAGASAGASFGDLLSGALNRVSEVQDRANDYAVAFARGDDVELHQVMASAEEAGIALELLAELRNKVVDAYHTLVGMQA